MRRRLVRAAPRRARRGSRRPGPATSVPGVGTPTHTSCCGSCSRVSGDQTTGIGDGATIFSMPPAPAGCAHAARSRPGNPDRRPADRADQLACSTSRAWASGTPPSTATSRTTGRARRRPHRRHDRASLAEDAYLRPVPAGGAVLNGAGECTGFLTAQEWGAAETPVYLTSTMQLGRVYDAACEIELEANAAVADDVVIPIVGECDDSFLNDCRRMQVTADDVRAARAAALASRGAGAPPAEGAVGAGTGMSCFDFKGGIGTASRVTAEGHTVAVLLLTNFGSRAELVVVGRPGRAAARPAPARVGRARRILHRAGRHRRTGRRRRAAQRLARRVGLGLARTGIGRAQRQRRDLPRLRHRDAAGPRRPARPRRPGGRPRPQRAVRGGRRGDRGGGAELDVHRADDRRPGRQHQRVPALARGSGAAGGVRS